jgi:hypothetical protein
MLERHVENMVALVTYAVYLVHHYCYYSCCRYGAPGDQFDPNLHDALYELDSAEYAPGTIGQVSVSLLEQCCYKACSRKL